MNHCSFVLAEFPFVFSWCEVALFTVIFTWKNLDNFECSFAKKWRIRNKQTFQVKNNHPLANRSGDVPKWISLNRTYDMAILPVDRQTDPIVNITFPQTTFAGGNESA